MHRLFVLFLMFLLPLQVFAGGIDTQIGFVDQTRDSLTISALTQQQQSDVAVVIDLTVSQDHVSDDWFGDDDSGEFNLHADLADETVPAHGFRFIPGRRSLLVVHSNDNVREPPFLPLVSPPPRA
ncbi:hypothetical protein ACVBEF_04800 [Glaciimonas sp. GG7]